MDSVSHNGNMQQNTEPEGTQQPQNSDDVEEISEEYEELSNTIDQLDSCLDKLEERNDDIYARLQELLESNRQTRRELEAERLASENTDSGSTQTETSKQVGRNTAMNARSQTFELSVEGRQIEEAVASLFHTLLFHRTLGKFHFKQASSYSVGTVGVQDVDCDFIDVTYVRVASDELDQALKREVATFRDSLRTGDRPNCGQISLEFYQKKPARWPFPAECIPWEVWTVKVDVLALVNEHERQICREKVGEILSEKIMSIADIMNRHEYTPKMPNQAELDLVFDTTFPDVQPYLYKISHHTTGPPSSATVGNTMRKFFKDTLAL